MALPGWAALREAGLWGWLLAGGIGLLVLLGLGFGGWSGYEAVRARGLGELAEASRLAQEAASLAQRDAAVRTLEGAIARYPSNRHVPEAAYHLGNLRYEAQFYEAARGAYTLALARGARGVLALLCRLGIANTWEAQGRSPEALAAYQEALRHVRLGDFLYEEVLMSVARAEELTGKPDQALETYHRILRELPETPRGGEIRWLLARLEKPPGKK